MNTIFSLVVAVQVISAIVIIGLVLIQHGKGADMGAAFGSGASGSLFGATGSSSFLSKATGIAATIFFCMTLALAYLGNRHTAPTGSVMDNLPAPTSEVPVPAAKAPATASAPAVEAAPAAASAAKPATTGHADQIPK
jgi:preprotein translocase subunit SecG